MKTLACYNLKGGVGKTAAAVNMAWLAARDGHRVLLWDLDPQGAASFYLRTAASVKGGSDRLLSKKKELRHAIRQSEFEGIDVVPADFSYRHMDADLRQSGDSRRRLAKLLQAVEQDYDLMLFDCPPSLSLVSENVFHAVEHLLVPLIPTHLSLRAYDQLLKFFDTEGIDRTKLVPFFSMVDRRRQLHLQVVGEFLRIHPQVLHSFVPYNSQVERMGIQQAPVGLYAGSETAGRAFEALWRAVRERIALAAAPGAA